MVARAAYDACVRLAQLHYENFPVASRLLPPATRPHVAAVYAFARTADDFADEGERTPAARLALLDDWQGRLHAAASGRVRHDGSQADLVFTALAETIATCRLDVGLFDDLLSAFRQDVTTTRYELWGDVIDYCGRSANPIGRIVLSIAGFRSPSLALRSDAVCTALQLTNFWQDLERDWRKGRLYIPLDVVRHHGVDLQDFDRRYMSDALKAAVRDVIGRTRALFQEGRSVADEVTGRLRWELRATWLGGVRILDRVEATDCDLFRVRPALGVRDALVIGRQMLVWR